MLTSHGIHTRLVIRYQDMREQAEEILDFLQSHSVHNSLYNNLTQNRTPPSVASQTRKSSTGQTKATATSSVLQIGIWYYVPGVLCTLWREGRYNDWSCVYFSSTSKAILWVLLHYVIQKTALKLQQSVISQERRHLKVSIRYTENSGVVQAGSHNWSCYNSIRCAIPNNIEGQQGFSEALVNTYPVTVTYGLWPWYWWWCSILSQIDIKSDEHCVTAECQGFPLPVLSHLETWPWLGSAQPRSVKTKTKETSHGIHPMQPQHREMKLHMQRGARSSPALNIYCHPDWPTWGGALKPPCLISTIVKMPMNLASTASLGNPPELGQESPRRP